GSGIHLGIDTGAGTEVEHGRVRGQQIQRQFLEPVAHQPVSRRGQHELVVLLSGMHVVDYLAGPLMVMRLCARRKAGTSRAPAGHEVSPRADASPSAGHTTDDVLASGSTTPLPSCAGARR